MAARRNTKETDMLVAIGKLETKVDSIGEDVKELKDGVKADIEFLKGDKIARAEAVRMQTDSMTKWDELDERVTLIDKSLQEKIISGDKTLHEHQVKSDEKIDILTRANTIFNAQWKTWLIVAGGVVAFLAFVITISVNIYFH